MNIMIWKRVDAMRLNGSNARDGQNLYNECRKMMSYHVVLTMQDGSQVDGIIESVELTSINVLVGEDAIYREDENQSNVQRQNENQLNMQRQYANPERYRRYRPRNFPLASLLALSLLPYPRYPYYPSTYPYYPSPYPYYPNPYPYPY